MKRRLTAITLILAIVASLFAVSAVSSSAATRPSPAYFEATKESNGFGLSWGRVKGATHYCLYMGYNNTWQAWRIITAAEYENYLSKYRHYPIYDKTLYSENVWHEPHKLTRGYAPKLIIGQEYCFQINSCNANGGGLGKWSKVVKEIYTPAAPKLCGNITSGAKVWDRKLRIYWNRIPGADAYELSRYNKAKTEWTVVATTKNCSFIDNGIGAGDWIYQIRAKAQNIQGKTTYGKWSRTQSMTYFPKIDVGIAFSSKNNHGNYITYNYNIEWNKALWTPGVTLRFYHNKGDIWCSEPIKTVYVTNDYYTLKNEISHFRAFEICYKGKEGVDRWTYEINEL